MARAGIGFPAASAPPPALSVELASRAVTLRAATTADAPFLLALFASFRAAELALMPWTAAQKAAFVADQFHLQHVHFTTQLDRVAFWVIERRGDDGVARPIGRLYLQGSAPVWRIVDIGLMPGERGTGLGGALMRWIEQSARGAGAEAIELQVAHNNPRAARLYAQLGFQPLGPAGEMHQAMRLAL